MIDACVRAKTLLRDLLARLLAAVPGTCGLGWQTASHPVLEHLQSVRWASLPQPAWNRPTTVPDAIRHLANPSSQDDARRAYHKFLYAVGNNHAGTYYPVVLDTLPFLHEILGSSDALARETVLDILVDLSGALEPALGHETVTSESGASVDIRQLLSQRLTQFAVLVESLVAQAPADSPARRLGEEVLEALQCNDDGE